MYEAVSQLVLATGKVQTATPPKETDRSSNVGVLNNLTNGALSQSCICPSKLIEHLHRNKVLSRSSTLLGRKLRLMGGQTPNSWSDGIEAC